MNLTVPADIEADNDRLKTPEEYSNEEETKDISKGGKQRTMETEISGKVGSARPITGYDGIPGAEEATHLHEPG